jgi:hypothetical protein
MPAAHAQMVGDPNTSVTGAPIYVEEEDADLLVGSRSGLNINGAMGLPLNPTASMPVKGSAHVQANYYKLWSHDAMADADSKLYGAYFATAVSNRIEFSAGLEKQAVSAANTGAGSAIEEAFDNSGIALGVKFLVNKPTGPRDVRIAVGAGYSKALYHNTNIYAVASKGFGARNRTITAHLGVRYDRFKVGATSLTDATTSSKASIFGGAEIPLDTRGRFSLVAELQSANTTADLGGAMPYSVSLRYQNGNGMSASLGMMRQGVLSDVVSDSGGVFAQVGKTF